MRNILASLFLLFAIALAAPDILAAFLEPLPETSPAQNNDTIVEGFELLKRQAGCASGYAACANLNVPGLCCRTNQVCSADAVGHVACCPVGAACTGTIANVGGPTISTAPSVSATTTGGPFATITTSPTFQQSSPASHVRSTTPALQLIQVASRMLRAVLQI